MPAKTVLISGASIAGPAVAYWLHRHGFATTVVERAPTLRPGGQAVDLRGVAREVVDRMGILPAVRRHGVDERGMAMVNARDRHVARVPVDLFDGNGPVAEIEIMRGDLTHILYEATRAHTDYRFGDHITQLVQHEDGVDVTFASGDARTFDIVLGADGIHSGVRRHAFGPASRFVRFLGGYTAYFTVPDPGDIDGWFLMFRAPGGRVAGIRPERGGTAKVSLSFRSPELTYDRADVARQRQILAGAFAGVGWRVPAMLAALPAAPDFYFDTICQVHVERWSQGRVALLGDAGYCGSPLTGMGTSSSLVGAYVLAGELARTPDDHEGAFTRYQEQMSAYVTACQQLPPGGLNGFAPKTAAGVMLSNLGMKMMTRWPVRQMIAKEFQKGDAISLPDYV